MPIIKKMHYPKDYSETIKLANDCKKSGTILVSLEKAKSKKEAKRIKDFLLGVIFAKQGFAFQYKKLILFSILNSEDLKGDESLWGWVW
jgi:hypothetical protein